jgi:hypothetical protein
MWTTALLQWPPPLHAHTMIWPMRNYLLPGLSLLLFACGLLLFFEVVRPFRDPDIDMPIAVGCWVFGVALAAAALWQRQGMFYLNLGALVLNALALAGIGALFVIFSTSFRLF